jgi:hypothetical protein
MRRSPHFAPVALMLLVLVVDLAYLAARGPAIAGDTPRYVEGGHALFHGEGLTARQELHAGYIVFVGLFQLAGLGNTAIAVGHIVVTALATGAVYGLARRLGGPAAGVIAALLFGLNPELVRWTTYILPEAMYVAWMPIAVWLVERAATERRGTVPAALALVVLASVRPNGWVPALLAASYLIVRRLPSWRGRLAAIGAVVVLTAAAFAALPAGRGDTDTLFPGRLLQQGVVIWDYPPSYLHVARDPSVTNRDWPGFAKYAVRHPVDTARVLGARAVVEARQTRSYYSRGHNLITLAGVLLLWAGAAIGAVVYRREPLVWLIGLIVLAHLALIALTIADFDGRFGRHYFGLLAVVAGAGYAALIARRARPRPAAARAGGAADGATAREPAAAAPASGDGGARSRRTS